MPDNSGLQNLLDLAGSIIDQGNGHWIKIEAWSITEVDRVLTQAKLK